jgi:hypothetical protein
VIPANVKCHVAVPSASARMFCTALLRSHDYCVATAGFLPLGNVNFADCRKIDSECPPKGRANIFLPSASNLGPSLTGLSDAPDCAALTLLAAA